MADEVVIGGEAVAPGERRTVSIPISDLATHTQMTMPVHVIRGKRPGPRLFICAALHGDELNGVEIIRRILKLSALKGLRGTLVAVPIVNVFGFLALQRYLPDRRDLNRSFPGFAKGSMAGRTAHAFLKEVVAGSTHGIDLHTGAIHRSNFPQIRANLDDPEVERLAHSFGVPVTLNASFRTGSLRKAAADLGVHVLVYEAGEALRFDEDSIRAGVKGVTRVMRAIGMLRSSGKAARRESIVLRSSHWVRSPNAGVFRPTVPLGHHVEAGEIVGYISDPVGETEVAIESAHRGVVIGRTNLPIVNEGDALFNVGRTDGRQVVSEILDAFEPGTDYQEGVTAELSEEPPIV